MSNARSRLAAYGRTPKALLRDPSIRPIAKTVFAIIDEVAGHEDITIAGLAEWLGVNEKTARRAVHEIRDAGWVEVIDVIEGQRGQRPSEYIANSYPFQADDQAERETGVPVSSTGPEETGTPPSQNVPSAPVEQTGVSKSDTPREGQKVGVPSSLRDDETPPPTSSAPSAGFKEFWSAWPASRYKGRRKECLDIWSSLPLEDKHDAWRALMAYKASEMWDGEDPGSPLRWLENEPWLEVRAGTLPKKKIDPYEGALIVRPGQRLPLADD